MENIYKTILDDALGAYWEFDFQTETLYVSPEFKLRLGYDESTTDTSRETWKQRAFPEDFVRSSKILQEHISSHGEIPYRTEVRYMHKNGSVVWMQSTGRVISWDNDGKPIRMVGCHFDITRQKEIGDALRISEEQFRTAFEFSANGIGLVSTKGQWLKVNKKLCETVGYTETELLQLTFQDITHPDDVATDLQLLAKTVSDGTKNVQREKRYIHKLGHEIWVLVNISILRNTQGEVLHFITQIQDITERKLNEKNLIKINQELMALFDSDSHVCIIATNTQGLITHFNKGSEVLLGYSKEEIIHKKTPLLFHVKAEVDERINYISSLLGESLDGFNAFVALAKRGQIDAQLSTFVRKDGSTFIVQLVITPIKNEANDITGYMGIATDISQIIATKKALQESEQRWQFALEGSSNGVWDWNMRTNESFYSKKWKSLIGYEDHEIPNTYDGWSSLVHPEDIKRCEKDLEMHYTGITPDYVNEHRMLCKDGTYKWILTRGKVIEWDEHHKPVRIMGTHTDITWQKEKEDELERTLDIVSEQNKRLLNFAHIVSHNLRSHSGNFKLFLDVMDVSDTPQEQEEAMSHLKDIYESLDETIKNLNEIVKIQTNISKQKEEINLRHYVEKTIVLLQGEIKQKQALVINSIPEELTVFYNAAYIESILLNFITNSIKYKHPDRAPQINISSYYEQEKLVLSIADNGLGIDLEKYGPKLFGMYKTFHGNQDAKGIGLFITKNQVDAMGGKIEVQSEINKGTLFKVYL